MNNHQNHQGQKSQKATHLRSLDIAFVIRGGLLALVLTLLCMAIGLIVIVAHTPFGSPPPPTPPPPTILAPAGELPSNIVAFQELLRYQGEPYVLAGSAFLLRLPDEAEESGTVIAVMTAHSMLIGDPNHPLERIALRMPGHSSPFVELDTFFGPPGHPRTGADMTVDYVLLQVSQPITPSLVLAPDPRGGPQPGERVALFSGLGSEEGKARVLAGTVQSVNDTSVWVVMDDLFNPSMMSGSPIISQHTGQVVGMTIAVSPRRNRLLIGFHPIASIMRHAAEAGGRTYSIETYRP